MKKEIKWFKKMDSNHLDSVWYGGEMVEICIGDYCFKVIATGDVSVRLDNVQFEDEDETGQVGRFLKENGITNDKELQEALENGKLMFWDNNWFELIGWDTKRKQYMFDWYDTIDLEPNDDFNWLDEIVKEYEEEL